MWKLIETWLKTLKWSKLRSIQRFSISKCSNWYNRSICTLLYINMTARNRSLCTKFILYAIILYGDQIVRRSFFMVPWTECADIKQQLFSENSWIIIDVIALFFERESHSPVRIIVVYILCGDQGRDFIKDKKKVKKK